MNEELDSIPAAVFSFDDSGTILEANRVFEEMLGCAPGALKGGRLNHILAPAERIYYQTHLFPALKMQGKLDEIYLKFVMMDRAGELPALVNVRREEISGAFTNRCVAMRLTLREGHQDEILRTKRAAEVANDSKAKFISMMSHELRTPLQSIFGYASLIRSDPKGSLTETQRTDLEAIETACASVGQMLDDIIQFARLDLGATQLEFTSVPVREAVERAEALLRPRLSEAGLTYRRGSIPRDALIWADDFRLQQILLNLLVNAIKFTPRGGQINISCRRNRDLVEINVVDSGPGIRESDHELIFKPFVQLDREQQQGQSRGVGLGLAISRDLARAMGGNLSVTSKLGKGSTFTIALPVAKMVTESNSGTKLADPKPKQKAERKPSARSRSTISSRRTAGRATTSC